MLAWIKKTTTCMADTAAVMDVGRMVAGAEGRIPRQLGCLGTKERTGG